MNSLFKASKRAPRIPPPQCLYQSRRWYAKKGNGNGKEMSVEEKKRLGLLKDPQDSSFKVQLFDSVYARVQREKKQAEEMARLRDLAPERFWHKGLFIALFAAAMGYYFGRALPPEPVKTSTTKIGEHAAPKHDTHEANMEAAWVDFRDIVGTGNIIMDKSELDSHSGSSWSSHPAEPGDVPFCIVKPASTEEVSLIMKVCTDRKIPVTAYSGGTSLEGHFAATRGGICIDFSRMDKVLALHKEDLDVVVQPAVGWESLNEELAKQNLFFPPDPGPGAMIGGMVGTGCSGTNAYRYGTMKEWVLSLTVVLADGTIIKTRQRPRKSSAGYDLTRMFIGSEGTLGLVTEATLKVTVKPQHTSVAVCAFPTVRHAADAVFRVVGAGVPIAAIEILDDVQMKCINDAGMTSKNWKESPTLFFKFAGTPSAVKEQISQVQGLARKAGSQSFEFAKNEAEREELWSARKEALWSVMAKKGSDDEKVWTTDVAVPISKLPQIIEETKEDIRKSGLVGSIVGHVGDGNFHSILLYNPKTQFALAKSIVHKQVKRAVELEGTATGEHGIGLVKRDYLPHELGQDTVNAMRRLKLAFDPLCLLNCDKVVRVEKPKRGEVEEW